MSVEALAWAFNLAPVPVDKNGKPSNACASVLQGLANHADPDGVGAFPSVATLIRYTRLSERTVRTSLDRLAAARIIRPCAPEIVAARIRRADRRPQGWDLDLTLIRDDLTDAEITILERQFPGLRDRIDLMRQATPADHSAPDNGVQRLHPAPERPVDNSSHGVQPPHPAGGTGCNERTNGVQLTQPRGAAAAPEPYIEPSVEPPAAPARAREPGPQPVENPAAGGGAQMDEFFGALGSAWRLSPKQRNRLAGPVGAAFRRGWRPRDLAAFVGSNTIGVRSPYAVLEARLRPAELPEPRNKPAARSPWCGQCDEQTRLVEQDLNEYGVAGSLRRCPRCWAAEPSHPVSAPANA